jgi:hypothetical protein
MGLFEEVLGLFVNDVVGLFESVDVVTATRLMCNREPVAIS